MDQEKSAIDELLKVSARLTEFLQNIEQTLTKLVIRVCIEVIAPPRRCHTDKENVERGLRSEVVQVDAAWGKVDRDIGNCHRAARAALESMLNRGQRIQSDFIPHAV
jgi:hypothetical protein